MGGGDGMGPLAKRPSPSTNRGWSVHGHRSPADSKLEAELKEQTWENKTFVYGFTHDMPDFMRAADVIVTKAGPGTIAEALIAQLPIILYAKLPGQEDGNVDFVVSEGAGVSAWSCRWWYAR